MTDAGAELAPQLALGAGARAGAATPAAAAKATGAGSGLAHYAVVDPETGAVLSWGTASAHLHGFVAAQPGRVAIRPDQVSTLHGAPRQRLVEGELVPIPPPPPPPPADQVRAQRNAALRASDAVMQLHQLPDYPATPAQKLALMEYRQQLRDVPAQPGFPATVAWPATPA